MTAEIAILNRTAVALAADSAVTLQLKGQQKIYNGADKLFQLSFVDPVGIMVYGGAEFMGIPLETVIKQFRRSTRCAQKPLLKDYADAFFEFLEQEVRCPPAVVEANIESILYSEIYPITQRVLREVFHLAGQGKKFDYKTKFGEMARKAVKSRIAALEKLDDCPVFAGRTTQDMMADYRAVLERLSKELFQDLNDEAFISDMLLLAGLVLLKTRFSVSSTGFVFAGFGKDEIFPTLRVFEADGIIAGKVKRREIRYIDIDRGGVGAHIEPFAQKEMVERFLDGIDPAYDRYIQSSLREILSEYGEQIVADHGPRAKRKKAEIINNLKDVVDQYLGNFAAKSEDRRKQNFRQKVLDMVHYMPKSELAVMAESLVSLTSMKRRVSAETETVGGPVDVAVISKGEGFVWIKRKHYFEPALNPRYFQNRKLPHQPGEQP